MYSKLLPHFTYHPCLTKHVLIKDIKLLQDLIHFNQFYLLSIVIGWHKWCDGQHGFKTWSVQTKDNNIGICNISTKHAASMSKSKDWFAQNHDNVSEWSDMSTHMLIQYKVDIIVISLNVTCYPHDRAAKLLILR